MVAGSDVRAILTKKSSQVEKDINNLCLSDHWKHPRFSLLVFVTSDRQIYFHLQTEVMKTNLDKKLTGLGSASCLAFMCNTSMGGPSTTPEKIDISEQCWPVFWASRYSTPNWLEKLVGDVHYASQPWKGMNSIRNTDLFVIVEMLFVETSVPMRLCFYEDKI